MKTVRHQNKWCVSINDVCWCKNKIGQQNGRVSAEHTQSAYVKQRGISVQWGQFHFEQKKADL